MRVVGLDGRDIEDIYEIRIRVEGLAARRAAERATGEQLAELKRVLDMQEFFTFKEDSDSIIDADNQFHDMLYRLSGSLVLYDTLSPLHRKIVRYRKVSVRHGGRAKESYAEHKAIYEAIAAHDPGQGRRAASAPYCKRPKQHPFVGGGLTWDTPLLKKSSGNTLSRGK